MSLNSVYPVMFHPRGNSKYHYYGIRLKPDSPLNRLQEDTQYMAMRQQPTHQKPRWVALARPCHPRSQGPATVSPDMTSKTLHTLSVLPPVCLTDTK